MRWPLTTSRTAWARRKTRASLVCFKNVSKVGRASSGKCSLRFRIRVVSRIKYYKNISTPRHPTWLPYYRSTAFPTQIFRKLLDVSALAFSPDGQTLASGSIDSTVHLWELHQPDAASTVLRSYEGGVWSLAFSPDGQTLALGIYDGTIQLRDLRQPGAEPTVLRGHERWGWVLALALSADGLAL